MNTRKKMITNCTDNLSTKHLLHAYILPAEYLKRQVLKIPNKDAKQEKECLNKLLASIDEKCKSKVHLKKMWELAAKIASFWQRSSSAIEGRNGLLSYRHHGLRGISETKLKCFTALHKFYIRRIDDTTAANRFFGAEHADIFSETIMRCVEIPIAYQRKNNKLVA